MHRFSFSRPRAGLPGIAVRGLPLAFAAGLALTAGACMTPSAKKSTAEGAAGERPAAAGSGSQSGKAEGGETKPKKPWWRLSQYSRGTAGMRRPGDLPPGHPGLFSGKDGEFVLYRKGEAGRSADPTKPTKVRR